MVNRAAVILKYKSPMIAWINESDQVEDSPEMTIEEANSDKTVYLISSDDAEDLDQWLKLNYKALFEAELEDWFLDENLWPKKRTRKVFDEWFDVECHSIIMDTVGIPIVDDEV